MRFKARVQAKDLSVLSAVVSSLEKMGHSCLIYLCESAVRFASPRSMPEDVKVFSEIIQDKVFAEYRIESLADNQILFEIGTSNLQKALHSSRGAPMVQIKLAKRAGQPCICLEARTLDIEFAHEIPVRVMRAQDIQYYMPPDVPTPQVQLELPYGRSMRTVVERLRSMDRYCFVDGKMDGSLVFRVDNDRVAVKTFYGGLIPRFDSMDEDVDHQNTACVKVETRKLAAALHFAAQPYDTAICCLIEESYLVLHVLLLPRGSGSMTYYVPLVVDA